MLNLPETRGTTQLLQIVGRSVGPSLIGQARQKHRKFIVRRSYRK